MTYTWNGLEVSNITPIAVYAQVPEYRYSLCNATEALHIEDQMKNELAMQLSNHIMQHATLHTQRDLANNARIFHAKVYMANILPKNKNHSIISPSTPVNYTPYVDTLASYNGVSNVVPNTISQGGTAAAVPDKLRVCEYTKNGKVTKVELQRYENHVWIKIPRVQIEE